MTILQFALKFKLEHSVPSWHTFIYASDPWCILVNSRERNMDDYDIDMYTQLVRDKLIEGWKITKYINHGKSAAVYKAEKDNGHFAAIKIFDRNMVKQFGVERQLERIEREKSLIGKHNDHLVRIFGGGYSSELELLYIIMEFLPADNLMQKNHYITTSDIPNILNQLVSACVFLEDNELSHRDIKLENIDIFDDLKTIKLLDLGVLHPLKIEYDHDKNMHFVATKRASPPELLFREEQHDKESWRAITFYQIGVVIYELLTKAKIFHEYAIPDARLVRAIEQVTPSFIEVEDQDNPLCKALIVLSRQCLLKDPSKRILNLSWDDFIDVQNKCDKYKIASNLRKLSQIKDIYPSGITSHDLLLKKKSQAKFFRERLQGHLNNMPEVFPQKVLSEIFDKNNSYILNIEFRNIDIPMIIRVDFNPHSDTVIVLYQNNDEWIFVRECEISSDEMYDDLVDAMTNHIVAHLKF